MVNTLVPKVRFTWNISYDCNYRCSYCFFEGSWEEYKNRTVYLSVDEWIKYWSAVHQKYGPIYLIITGGEPVIYPNFIELIKSLSNLCYHINISTNSSGDLDAFIERINPDRVSLSLSFQKEFDTLENFIRKVKLIKRHGFLGCINLVAYPPFLGELEDNKRKLLLETGEEFKVIAFFGNYNNRDYPDGYTLEERKLIGLTDSWLSKIKRKGTLCSAGNTSALLFPDGKVVRCGQIGERFIIGNFFDPNFKLYDKPLLCDVDYCPCAEYSITGYEDDIEDTISTKVLTKGLPQDNINQEKSSFNFIESSVTKTHNSKELLELNRGLSHLNNKINFAWDIHYKCNFRCPYCWFFDNWAKQARRNLYLSPQEWMVYWKRVFDRYGEVHIAITGGEPFIYPSFIELVRELSSLHIVKITTNMSGDIEKFVKEISPARVYLDLNFHPMFVRDFDKFIRKTKLLHDAGFDAGVCYLAYPPQLGMLNLYKKRFEESGIRFALAAFWGKYQNKQYPASYTNEEKEIIKPFIGEISRIEYHLNSTSPKGKICNAGYRYANIQGDGKVVRCAQYADQLMGNIIDPDFHLFNEPLPCEKDACPGNEYDNILSC